MIIYFTQKVCHNVTELTKLDTQTPEARSQNH